MLAGSKVSYKIILSLWWPVQKIEDHHKAYLEWRVKEKMKGSVREGCSFSFLSRITIKHWDFKA
jgi:hypothetical protein